MNKKEKQKIIALRAQKKNLISQLMAKGVTKGEINRLLGRSADGRKIRQ